jgi:hypothetical protein
MKNLRVLSMRPGELELADHDDITDAMKRAGFKFDRSTCPVKLRKPWTAHRDDESGIVYFMQWDATQ